MNDTPRFTIQMFGGLIVQLDGKSVSDPLRHSKKLQALLSYLLLERQRVVSMEEFYDLFWPGATNPKNALKTLVHRLRAALVEGGVPSTIECIQQRQGGYQWNPKLEITMDVERFEANFQRLQEENLDRFHRLQLLEEALALYHGPLLDQSAFWITSVGVRLQNCYRAMALQLCALYREMDRTEDAVIVSRNALHFDPLDEELARVLIVSLLDCGRNGEALEQYQATTEMCYTELGVQPSEELRALYRKIAAAHKEMDLDIESVCNQLEGEDDDGGAYICEYGIFQDLYRIETRCLERYGGRVFLGLLTVTDASLHPPTPAILSRTMDQLLDVIRVCLRRGDIVARFSPVQYVLLLPTVTYETGCQVLERIRNTFRRRYPKAPVVVTCKLRPLRPPKEQEEVVPM